MGLNLSDYKSHPHKELTVHTQGVLDKTMRLTKLEIARIAAIFHDLGKLNPNFQAKLGNPLFANHTGYSHHAYLSAYGFLAFLCVYPNECAKLFPEKTFQSYLAVVALIARHHGNLPDFNDQILSCDECESLFKFVNSNPNPPLPMEDFLKHFNVTNQSFDIQLIPQYKRDVFQQKTFKMLRFKTSFIPQQPLQYFLETQFSFAALIRADKADAGDLQFNTQDVAEFCEGYAMLLEKELANFTNDSPLNQIRTRMREEAVQNVQAQLQTNQRVFSLTAPTGSGKTLMLLSLAGEILKTKGNLRIIYALPFLSITEQVEGVCTKIFGDKYVLRIDSRAENQNFQNLQGQADDSITEQQLNDLLSEDFAQDTFDYPFIITTFVRFFETLVSNKNNTLLKLSSFSNAIVLIDEIQSLPPRLYGFFVAYLNAFCQLFDSYVIVSTATMPNFELPDNEEINTLFNTSIPYLKPPELLSFCYFDQAVFNRYEIHRNPNPMQLEDLAESVKKEVETHSVLVILNTIDDSRELYDLLNLDIEGVKVLLLNTHITPNDRKSKIECAKKHLISNKKVILVSTQLIEAGVDIDFPVVYRDFAPIPNLIQSAGRCNRNGKLKQMGKMVVVEIQKDMKSRCRWIYEKDFLTKTKAYLSKQPTAISESRLLAIQKGFFNFIQTNLRWGTHRQTIGGKEEEINFIQSIPHAEYEQTGKFRLIDEELGEEKRYYIIQDDTDNKFEKLKNHLGALKATGFKDYKKRKTKMVEIENHLKTMTGNTLQIRVKESYRDNLPLACDTECCGLLPIQKEDSERVNYTFEEGLNLKDSPCFI